MLSCKIFILLELVGKILIPDGLDLSARASQRVEAALDPFANGEHGGTVPAETRLGFTGA